MKHQSQLWAVLLLSVRNVSALITTRHQALIKVRKERTLTYSTSLLKGLRSQPRHIYICFYLFKTEAVQIKVKVCA